MTATSTAGQSTQALSGPQSSRHQKTATNVGTGERVASIIGGVALAGSGVYVGLRKNWWGAALSILGGGDLLYRGITGRSALYRSINYSSAGDQQQQGGGVERAVTINRPVEDLYRFWRDFTNLPRFMSHLESVTTSGGNKSHWVARAPLGQHVTWNAEITEDLPNQKISWKSLPKSQVFSAGTVTFTPAPGQRGTVVKAVFIYRPPAGAVGATVAKFFGDQPNQQVADDLAHFKQMLEAGEIASTAGQPTGR